MNDKFIRLLSPISLAVYGILDLAVLAFGVFAIKKATVMLNTWVIIFIAIEIFAIIIAIIGTKELLSNGVKFSDDEAEFTGVDDNNIVAYDDIITIEAYRDTAASFTKNFDMRHSLLIFTLKDESGEKTNTIDIGLVNNGALNKVLDEFKKHVDADKITFTQVKKSKLAAKIEKAKEKPADENVKNNNSANEGVTKKKQVKCLILTLNQQKKIQKNNRL